MSNIIGHLTQHSIYHPRLLVLITSRARIPDVYGWYLGLSLSEKAEIRCT